MKVNRTWASAQNTIDFDKVIITYTDGSTEEVTSQEYYLRYGVKTTTFEEQASEAEEDDPLIFGTLGEQLRLF